MWMFTPKNTGCSNHYDLKCICANGIIKRTPDVYFFVYFEFFPNEALLYQLTKSNFPHQKMPLCSLEQFLLNSYLEALLATFLDRCFCSQEMPGKWHFQMGKIGFCSLVIKVPRWGKIQNKQRLQYLQIFITGHCVDIEVVQNKVQIQYSTLSK